MKLLEEKVLKEGIAVNENILKVDGFINHQIDPELMKMIGEDFAEHFKIRALQRSLQLKAPELHQP